MAARKAKGKAPDLGLDLRIRLWVYGNVGSLVHELPEAEPDSETGPALQVADTPLVKKMTSYLGTLEAIESLLELFPISERKRTEQELVRLFVNRRGGTPAPPYASWYLDGRINGESTEWVAERYREQGLDASGAGEPPDFLPAEFEFMEYLCGRELEARESGDEEALAALLAAQKVFVTEHLVRWLPGFARCIRKAEPIPLFARLARVLEIFSEEEGNRRF